MGFWSRVGRWLASAVGLLFVIIGFNALWHGLDIIQVERGWTGVIAGTTAMSAGVLMLLLTVLIDRVEGLRLAMLTQRALQAADVAPGPAMVPDPLPEDEPEPPKPIEIPVEPPPVTAASAAPAAFSFRTFGKRSAPERPMPPLEEPRAEPRAETPAPAPELAPEPDMPPEQVRRFAPPQFRRPTPVPPPPPEDMSVAQAAPPPASEPEPASAPADVVLTVVDVEEITQTVTVAVEASITEAIAEELRLPRASNLPPIPPVEAAAETAAVEAAPAPAPVPQAPEGGVAHRGLVQTHEWLEKALSGEEREPALDWLRQRRGSEERPERKVPSFMRRHVEADGDSSEQATAPAEAPQAELAPAAPAAEAPAVVGRYAANGSDYTLYANGSIDAQTPEGPRHFSSMEELRAFLQRQTAPTEG